MSKKKNVKTAESVCIGHPDKLCDLIADSVLDECLSIDKNSRVACEVLAAQSRIFIAGEITCGGKPDIANAAKSALKTAGYDSNKFEIQVQVHEQSKDIAGGVDAAIETRNDGNDDNELGAGDQGTVYGYATDETPEMLPLPLILAHGICKGLDDARVSGAIEGIHSDGKAQVSVEYDGRTPKRIKVIVVSVQHDEDKDISVLQTEICEKVLNLVFKGYPLDESTEILINPSGRFVYGGPEADSGLTGRKLMVDTYGGLAAHGGGAFSGKDPTKVDRSGAYMARKIAKDIVRQEIADEVQIGISYAIGKADPLALSVNTFGTGKISDEKLAEKVLGDYNLRPGKIIDFLKLRNVKYAQTATYGHFKAGLPWEE